MPSRKKKSLLFGSAPDTVVYHREHRSKKGRQKKMIKESKSPFYKEKIKKYEEEKYQLE